MRLSVNGLPIDSYSGDLTFLSEFKEGYESIDIIDLEQALYIPEVGTENLIWETAKLAGGLTKDFAKGAYKAQKQVGSMIKDARQHWNRVIKPMIHRILKEFQTQLQNMWAKYMKYDQKYKELGKEINSVINVFGDTITSIPKTRLKWHAFDAQTLVGYMQIIQSYDTYMKAIIDNKKLFPNGMVSPKEFAKFAEVNDVRGAQNALNSLTEGIGNLNQFGELGMVKVFWEDKRSKFSVFSKFDNRLLKAAVDEKTSMTEFVEGTILRGVNEKTFDSSNVTEFRRDFIQGNGAYLQVMRNMLNNNVIANILTKGGNSIKKQTKEELSNMEAVVKIALDKQMKSQQNAANQNRNKQNNEDKVDPKQPQFNDNVTDQLKNDEEKAKAQTKADQGGQEAFSDFFGSKSDGKDSKPTAEKGDVKDRYENQYAPDADPVSIVELSDNYIQAYTLLMSKAAQNYSSIVRGTLAATYTLIKECTDVVAFVKSVAQKAGTNVR